MRCLIFLAVTALGLSIVGLGPGLLVSDVQAADPEIITEPVCSGGIHYIDRTHKSDSLKLRAVSAP